MEHSSQLWLSTSLVGDGAAALTPLADARGSVRRCTRNRDGYGAAMIKRFH
jgi:hypothetical protein